ncbi:uncharacterized mitochondrial protein AtMg00810-like [Lathyrus oleraceus]|uniref:uncharacterized mitochondrial protein AtMg00810-like n=1 Tax=Pisum sativum TaxID=3888 RepID=UPI0021D33648|nr:uncharacterized mitochondrial protein AtMg00810-like [Pisum sativum]
MQEELCQFEMNKVWELVPRTEDVNFIGTNWIYKNKFDESGNVTRNKVRTVQHFVQQMQSKFEMSLVGELTYFLGLQVNKMEENIFMSQRKYAKSIVKQFGLDNAIHKRTHVVTHLKLSRDENGDDVDQSLYKSMIGNLLYLTTSMFDITFVVGVCARYQVNLKASHLTQVKRILKYINGTYDYGLLYSHDINLILVGYCDADWARSAYDRKSTSGGCFFIFNNLISWLSKK